MNNILDRGFPQRKKEIDADLETLKKKGEEERIQQAKVGDKSRNKKKPRNEK